MLLHTVIFVISIFSAPIKAAQQSTTETTEIITISPSDCTTQPSTMTVTSVVDVHETIIEMTTVAGKTKTLTSTLRTRTTVCRTVKPHHTSYARCYYGCPAVDCGHDREVHVLPECDEVKPWCRSTEIPPCGVCPSPIPCPCPIAISCPPCPSCPSYSPITVTAPPAWVTTLNFCITRSSNSTLNSGTLSTSSGSGIGGSTGANNKTFISQSISMDVTTTVSNAITTEIVNSASNQASMQSFVFGAIGIIFFAFFM